MACAATKSFVGNDRRQVVMKVFLSKNVGPCATHIQQCRKHMIMEYSELDVGVEKSYTVMTLLCGRRFFDAHDHKVVALYDTAILSP